MNMPAGYSPIGDINSGDQSFGARRPYLVDGDYNLEIERCVERGRGTDKSFVIEATIVESNAPERPAGTQIAIFIDLTNNDTRGKHLCAFIAACQGYDPMQLPKNSSTTPWDGQQWAGYVVWAMSEQNPYGKRKIHCNAQSIFTTKNTPWTLHTFSPYGSKAVGVRIYGPAFGAPAGAPGAAPGGNGFQAPMQQPGAAPQGFAAAPMPPQGMPAGGGPLGGFTPPGAPGAAPPAGWGPPAPAAAPGFQAPQPGFQPQQQPAQPVYAPPAAAPGYQPQQQPVYAPPPAAAPGYQPQQQPVYQQPQQPVYQQPQQPVYQPPQQQPGGYVPQPGQPTFGGPWGGGGQR